MVINVNWQPNESLCIFFMIIIANHIRTEGYISSEHDVRLQMST